LKGLFYGVLDESETLLQSALAAIPRGFGEKLSFGVKFKIYRA
jgi:hypothetical protein